MPLPDVTETIRDGALGIVSQNSDNIQVKLGISTLGAPNTLYGFSSVQQAVATLGVGPLVEAVAHSLSVAGGPVYAMPISGSVAGVAGSVTHTGTGTATLAVSGTPNDSYSVQVNIISGAALLSTGTATCQISLDGGNTFGPVTTIPSSGIITLSDPRGNATGLTLTWTYVSGTAFVAGDQFVFTNTAPGYTLSDATTTFDALLALNQDWAWVHFVGLAASVSAAASLAAGVESLLGTAATQYRYGFAVIEVPQDTDANIVSGFSSFSGVRTGVCAGFETLVSPISGRLMSRSVAFGLTSRLQKVSPSTDAGRVADGPLEGCRALSRNEFATPNLDQHGFTTARTIIGLQGFFITNPRLMTNPGSDYTYIQNRRVMDIASKTARTAALNYLNSSVRANANGTIADRDASVIEAQITNALQQALTVPGDASAVSVKVDRTNNIVSTGQLLITIRVTPLGYAKSISLDLGFTNPSLALTP